MVTSVVWTEEVGTSPGTLASYRLMIPHRESPQTSCAGRPGCAEASKPTLPFESLPYKDMQRFCAGFGGPCSQSP